MTNKVMIISENVQKNYELSFIKSGLVEYILIDNIEYAVGYLFVNRNDKCPKIVYMDYTEENVNKFITLCNEIDIDMDSFQTVTSIGRQLNIIQHGDYMSYKPISEDDFNELLLS